jgi:hypothetical protein
VGQQTAGLKPRLHNGKANGNARPTLDEWGLYDPAKAGFDALYAKLEEIEERGDAVDDPELDELPDSPAPTTALGRNPRPLSMWAWRIVDETRKTPPKANGIAPDDFRGLVAGLRIPPAIAAVRYATGARIRRVRVSPAANQPKHDGAQVIILSRKLLNSVRQQPAAPRRSSAA